MAVASRAASGDDHLTSFRNRLIISVESFHVAVTRPARAEGRQVWRRKRQRREIFDSRRPAEAADLGTPGPSPGGLTYTDTLGKATRKRTSAVVQVPIWEGRSAFCFSIVGFPPRSADNR
jgi:hypothetical protein